MSDLQQQLLLTGSIGSGKTTVAHFFQQLGFTYISTDQIAKNILLNDKDTQLVAKQLFGDKVIQDGQVELVYFAQHFFMDADKRARYETHVHPKVEQAVMTAKEQHQKLLVEIPLLWECWQKHPDAYAGFNLVLTVEAHDTVRKARIQQRDPQRSTQQIAAIMGAQTDRVNRCEIAQICIENDQSLEALYRQLNQVLLSL